MSFRQNQYVHPDVPDSTPDAAMSTLATMLPPPQNQENDTNNWAAVEMGELDSPQPKKVSKLINLSKKVTANKLLNEGKHIHLSALPENVAGFLQVLDTDGTGTIDEKELMAVVEDSKKLRENNSLLKNLVYCFVGLFIALLACNTYMTYIVVEEAKSTEVSTTNVMTVKGSDDPVQCASTDADLLISAPQVWSNEEDDEEEDGDIARRILQPSRRFSFNNNNGNWNLLPSHGRRVLCDCTGRCAARLQTYLDAGYVLVGCQSEDAAFGQLDLAETAATSLTYEYRRGRGRGRGGRGSNRRMLSGDNSRGGSTKRVMDINSYSEDSTSVRPQRQSYNGEGYTTGGWSSEGREGGRRRLDYDTSGGDDEESASGGDDEESDGRRQRPGGFILRDPTTGRRPQSQSARRSLTAKEEQARPVQLLPTDLTLEITCEEAAAIFQEPTHSAHTGRVPITATFMGMPAVFAVRAIRHLSHLATTMSTTTAATTATTGVAAASMYMSEVDVLVPWVHDSDHQAVPATVVCAQHPDALDQCSYCHLTTHAQPEVVAQRPALAEQQGQQQETRRLQEETSDGSSSDSSDSSDSSSSENDDYFDPIEIEYTAYCNCTAADARTFIDDYCGGVVEGRDCLYSDEDTLGFTPCCVIDNAVTEAVDEEIIGYGCGCLKDDVTGLEECKCAMVVYECFAGSETVQLESGAHVPISEVKFGDRVLTLNDKQEQLFSPVIHVPHARNEIPGQFVKVTTTAGRTLTATPEHLIRAGECAYDASTAVYTSFNDATVAATHAGPSSSSSSSLQPSGCKNGEEDGNGCGLVKMKDVQDRMCVRTTDGVEQVVRVETVVGFGKYSLITEQPWLVVNGVVASPFAHAHAMPFALYSWTHYLFPSFFDGSAETRAVVEGWALFSKSVLLKMSSVATTSFATMMATVVGAGK